MLGMGQFTEDDAHRILDVHEARDLYPTGKADLAHILPGVPWHVKVKAAQRRLIPRRLPR
jgi:hypothetical protein